jgi:phospholipid/cholesterol/gamma-HCH transport system permease protein
MPLDFAAAVGREFLELLRRLGSIFLFLLEGLALIFQYPFQFRKILNQMYFIGVKSILVILLMGLFTGMVLGLQGYYTLSKFGSEGVLGAMVALSVIRELGPVLTALMVIGRAGSAMAAEIGIMRITEQIDALYTMDVNPVRYLFSPRIVASVLAFPMLTALCDVIAIIGGYLTGVVMLGVNAGIYFSRMQQMVVMADIMTGFYKSLAFGLLVVTICCFMGYFVHERKGGFGAKGVSLATTSAVVMSSVLVLATDYVLTSFLL